MEFIMSKEIKIDPRRKLVTKTNFKGIIVYGNDEFTKKSGFKKEEYIFKPHNIIRHPDMPKIIFEEMWKNIKKKKNFFSIVKNKTKSGNYYWVWTDFEIELDHSNLPDYYIATRRAVPSAAKKEIIKLYDELLVLEKTDSLQVAREYLEWFLKEKKMDFNEYMLSLLKKKSLTERLRGF
jgi:PAS domain S-box-containing protein